MVCVDTEFFKPRRGDIIAEHVIQKWLKPQRGDIIAEHVIQKWLKPQRGNITQSIQINIFHRIPLEIFQGDPGILL